MTRTRIVEYVFFFGILGATAYVVWNIVAPFFGALVVASIIVTVGYPWYRKVLHYTPRHNKSIAALLTTFLIALLVVVPLLILGYLVFSQTLSFYISLNQDNGVLLNQSIAHVETFVQHFAPSFTLEMSDYARQATGWFAAHIGTIFAETASTLFLIIITIIGVFYFFRDGEQCIRYLVALSPLPDTEDEHILKRVGQSVRSVVLGTLAVAFVQGLLTATGFALFGINNPLLWGAVAAVSSLIPGIGTLLVSVFAVAFLLLQGSYITAIGLTIWAFFTIGTIDNVLRPYLITRGVALHPFLVLLSVLGGIALFGPIGFVLGPVTLSLFTVLLELYSAHTHSDQANE